MPDLAETKFQLPPPPAGLKIASTLEIKFRGESKGRSETVALVLPFLPSRETIQQEIGLGVLP